MDVSPCSLIPRPHPLMRKNNLVNQVEFIGLAMLLRQCNLAAFKTFCGKPAQKRYGYLSRVVREVLCAIYHFLGISQKNYLV